VQLSNTAICKTTFALSAMQSVVIPPLYAQQLFTTHKPRPHNLWQSEKQASKYTCHLMHYIRVIH